MVWEWYSQIKLKSSDLAIREDKRSGEQLVLLHSLYCGYFKTEQGHG